jgi:hypothetical protein
MADTDKKRNTAGCMTVVSISAGQRNRLHLSRVIEAEEWVAV